MSSTSTIEWTDATWNPITGCKKVSPGCDNCYAERITERFHGKGSFERIELHPHRLDAPTRWRRPRRVFVNSMSDLFHAMVPKDYIEQVWTVMAECQRHQFQVLTKRAERMDRVVNALTWHLTNVWLGVSVESPDYYSRIRHLQRTPAAVRFLSCEPLLAALPELPLDGIDWVIVGGESGPDARPMHPEWVRDIRDQCEAAGVAFFFKQWGEWSAAHRNPKLTRSRFQYPSTAFTPDGTVYRENEPDLWNLPGMTSLVRVGKKRAGRLLDGRTYDAMPREVARV